MWKHLKDYERATEHFRSKKPDVGKFEKWRAILAAQLSDNFTHDQSTTIEAVSILSQVDPVLATRLENSIRRLELSFRAEFAKIASNDPERYAQLIYNQDYIIDITLSDYRKAANKLSARVSIIQQIKSYRYFRSVEEGTKDFNEGMEEQEKMLQKVVNP